MLRHKHKELSGSTCSLLNQDLEGRRPNPESEALGGPSSQGAVAGGCRGVFWFGDFFNFTCHPSGVRGHHFPSPRTGRHAEALLARCSSPGADMHKLPRVSLDCGYQFEFNKQHVRPIIPRELARQAFPAALAAQPLPARCPVCSSRVASRGSGSTPLS